MRALDSSPTKATATLVAVLALYIAASLLQVTVPGVYYDEVILVNQAFEVLTLRFPILGNVAYVGALKAYLHAPFVALFGGSVMALRAVPVLVTAGSASLLYLLLQEVLGSRSRAIAATALFLSHPMVLFSCRMDDGPVSTVMFLELLAMVLIARAVLRLRPGYLTAAGLIAALGCWQKAYFIWLFIAAIPLLLIHARRIGLPHRSIVMLAGLGSLGCLPFLAVVLTREAPPLGAVGQPAIDFPAVFAKAVFLWRTLTAEAGADWLTGRMLAVTSTLPWLIVLAVVLPLNAPASREKRLLYPIAAVAAGVALQAMITPVSGLALRHYALVFPLIALLVASSLAASTGAIRRILGVLVAVTIATNLVTLVSYHRLLAETGGIKIWSDAIYSLAAYTQEQPQHTYVALDWGISEPLRYLTEDRIRVREEPWVYPGAALPTASALMSLVNRNDVRFLMHGQASEVFSQGREIFFDYLSKNARVAALERAFSDRSGDRVFAVLRIASHPDPHANQTRGMPSH